MTARCFHVDVFATGPLSGNGLAVFLDTDGWSAPAMQRLTQEMKQFETIFLSNISPTGATARVFTVEEELPDDLLPAHPACVASTGLPYLIVPVRPEALARTAIRSTDLEAQLAPLGAKFVFVFDLQHRELRTWDNLGQVEDVATGSAAGPAAAYLVAQGLARAGEPIELAQGRFTGRSSRITVGQQADGDLLVRGEVWPVSSGKLELDNAELRR